MRVVLVLSTSLISDDDDDEDDDDDDKGEEDIFTTTFPSLSSSLSIEMLLSVNCRNILSTDINTTAMRNKITYLTNRFELILCAKPRPVVFLD